MTGLLGRSRRLLGPFALAVTAAWLCGCGKADEDKRPGSAEQFSLKDYLCTITPAECHRKALQSLYLAPPDAIYETTLGGKAFHIPMGYIGEIQVMSSGELRDQELFLNALGPEMQPRSTENIREFIRNGQRPALVRFNVMSVKSVGSLPWWEGTVDEAVKDHIERLTARKRYPDKYGLQHWGVDYARARFAKPCEFEGEMQQCGMERQDDLYVPIDVHGGARYMKCASWLYLKTNSVDKELAMSLEEREVYYQSDEYKKRGGWHMNINPHCNHYFYHEHLNARVRLSYHLSLLPHWQQMEERTRALLDAALSAASAAQMVKPPR
ncbi:hypothetical protein GCM10023165_53400 [Variovorax defluvii]|uniref:Uncharacterized protein n=1 Tax=Variovorax defluvii TaxID=913761 RepID=A0ABP8IGM1_9BURK